ncbi:MAG: glycosyltransferase family 2 protein [Calditrichaeota bacterium]|nr:glycosyltransferase family 2 protein [Calditrichota bacterium]
MSVSLLLPLRNECARGEADLQARLEWLRALPGVEEWIAVDGASQDASADVAQRAGFQLLRTEAGRGIQLEAARRAARGDLLWMVHADTRPPRNGAELIEEAFRDPRVQVSAFALSFQPEGWDLRLVAWGGNLRCRLRGTPYGDQALAFRASSLAALGGLPAWPYLEDLWCVTRLKAPGFLRLLPGHCPTSGRRYRERGVWRTLWQHQRILAHFRRHGCPLPEDR